jgi:hypothetical protein
MIFGKFCVLEVGTTGKGDTLLARLRVFVKLNNNWNQAYIHSESLINELVFNATFGIDSHDTDNSGKTEP